jgi:hypothetical protein
MTFANKLGTNYSDVRASARFKTITVQANDVVFDIKVRIPVKREMDALASSITEPDSARVNAIYESLSSPLRKTLEDAEEGFLDAINKDGDKILITNDDVIVDGTSVRQVAKMTAIWQTQVEKYFSLLQSATGEPITESYDGIAEEFPEAVIREIVSKIDEAIKPNYKESKKN